jgi:hypothetical protein
MATVDYNGPMDLTLKAIGLRVKPMEEVSSKPRRVIYWKENGRKTKPQD